MFISRSAEETVEFGRRFASKVEGGTVLGLIGELGSGKTHFVKGLVLGLAGGTAVTSPTFSLLHEYRDGDLPVYHFDFYRLENAEAARAIGFDDYVFGEGVTVIEWADRFPDLLPETCVNLRFESPAENERIIRVDEFA